MEWLILYAKIKLVEEFIGFFLIALAIVIKVICAIKGKD